MFDLYLWLARLDCIINFPSVLHWCGATRGDPFSHGHRCPVQSASSQAQSNGNSEGWGGGRMSPEVEDPLPPPSTVPWPSTSPLKGLFVRAVESRDHQSSASTMFRKSIVVRRMWDVRVKYAWHSSCTHRCTRNASRCMLVQAHTHTYLRLHAYGVSSTALVCARWENLWNKVCICISIL